MYLCTQNLFIALGDKSILDRQAFFTDSGLIFIDVLRRVVVMLYVIIGTYVISEQIISLVF